MPEFQSFWQWLGWLIIFALVLSILDNMFANYCGKKRG